MFSSESVDGSGILDQLFASHKSYFTRYVIDKYIYPWFSLCAIIADANVKKYLLKVDEKLKSELQKEKAMYRGMFSSSSKGEESS